MSKRLQVVMDDAEYDEIQEAADARRLTVSAWVRQTLRAARRQDPTTIYEEARAADAAGAPPNRPANEKAPDPELVRKVMERHGLSSPAEAIEFALRRTAEPALTRSDLLQLRGTGWSGDLDALRSHARGTTSGGGESS